MLKTLSALALAAAVSAPMSALAAEPGGSNPERALRVVPDKTTSASTGQIGTFAITPPQGVTPGKETGGDPSDVLKIVRPPEGTTPGSGSDAEGSDPDNAIIIRPPVGVAPDDDREDLIVSPPEPIRPPVIADVEGTLPDFDEDDDEEDEDDESDFDDTEEDSDDDTDDESDDSDGEDTSEAETGDDAIAGAADLYEQLSDRGYDVSVLRHDAHNRLVFLIRSGRDRYAHLVLVDGPSGDVLQQRRIDLAHYGAGGYGGHEGHYAKRKRTHRYYAPQAYRSPETCHKTGRRHRAGHGYGYSRRAY